VGKKRRSYIDVVSGGKGDFKDAVTKKKVTYTDKGEGEKAQDVSWTQLLLPQ